MDTSHQFEWCASATAAAVASRPRTGVSDVKGVDGVNQIGGIGSAEQPTKDERWGINGNGRMNRIIATKALYTPRVLRLDGWVGMGWEWAIPITMYYPVVHMEQGEQYDIGRLIKSLETRERDTERVGPVLQAGPPLLPISPHLFIHNAIRISSVTGHSNYKCSGGGWLNGTPTACRQRLKWTAAAMGRNCLINFKLIHFYN